MNANKLKLERKTTFFGLYSKMHHDEIKKSKDPRHKLVSCTNSEGNSVIVTHISFPELFDIWNKTGKSVSSKNVIKYLVETRAYVWPDIQFVGVVINPKYVPK